MRPEAQLLQKALDGGPLRYCSVIIRTDSDDETIQVKIENKAALRLVEAIVRILTEDDKPETQEAEA